MNESTTSKSYVDFGKEKEKDPINERLKNQEKAIKNLTTYITSRLKKIESDSKEELEKLKKESLEGYENTKRYIFEALGIFIAIFTFLSLSVNVFTRVNTLGQAVWLIILVFFLIFTLLLSSQIMINRRSLCTTEYRTADISIFILLLFSIVCIVLVMLNRELYETKLTNIDEDVKRYEDNVFIDQNFQDLNTKTTQPIQVERN